MPGVGAGVGHVHFMFFVLISFAFSSQRKPSFRWNMGLSPKQMKFTSCNMSDSTYILCDFGIRMGHNMGPV